MKLYIIFDDEGDISKIFKTEEAAEKFLENEELRGYEFYLNTFRKFKEDVEFKVEYEMEDLFFIEKGRSKIERETPITLQELKSSRSHWRYLPYYVIKEYETEE